MPTIYIDSDLVPQANDLEEVFQVGEILVRSERPTASGLCVDSRQVDYYRHAAKPLRLVDGRRAEDLRPTDGGRRLLAARREADPSRR